MIRRILLIRCGLAMVVAACLFIYPPIRAFVDMQDPALRGPGMPKAAWRVFRNLTPRYETWARERIATGQAAMVSVNNISGTEWPLFGSLFYLWGVENLQCAWDDGDRTMAVEPKVFAKEAIISASELVIDPKHASWVKKHWGENYLHIENVFYRMLVIGALTSREKLLHDNAHIEMLRDQVESFARELDTSRTGLLNDYPGQCYPGDVMAALMCIKRADSVLGTDHSQFLRRALRAFTARGATQLGLPPYAAGAATGYPISEARGCGNSYMCQTAPELWPEQAKIWYDLYDRLFWQERMLAAGYREFSKTTPHSNWLMDVDAGPVFAGYGTAANAFGVGAARKNGRFDRAYPLSAELFATVGELPNGVMAVPRILSNLSDAPMLGEAAILCQLSARVEKGFETKAGGSIPLGVFVILLSVFAVGIWLIASGLRTLMCYQKETDLKIMVPRLQLTIWGALALLGFSILPTRFGMIGAMLLLLAVMLPVARAKRKAVV